MISAYPLEPPWIEGDGFVLRGVSSADRDDVLRTFSDTETQRWWSWGETVSTVEAAEEFVESAQLSWEGGKAFTLAVEVGGRFSGLIQFATIPDSDDLILAYVVSPWSRRGGLAVRSLRKAIEWAFTETGAPKLVGAIIVGNEVSRRVARAVGFNLTSIAEVELRGEVVEMWFGTLWRDLYG